MFQARFFYEEQVSHSLQSSVTYFHWKWQLLFIRDAMDLSEVALLSSLDSEIILALSRSRFFFFGLVSYGNNSYAIMWSICLLSVHSHLSFSLSVSQYSPELLVNPFTNFNQIWKRCKKTIMSNKLFFKYAQENEISTPLEKKVGRTASYLPFGSSQIANKYMCIGQPIHTGVGPYWTFQNYFSSDEHVTVKHREHKSTNTCETRFHYFCFLLNNLTNDLFHFRDDFTVFYNILCICWGSVHNDLCTRMQLLLVFILEKESCTLFPHCLKTLLLQM